MFVSQSLSYLSEAECAEVRAGTNSLFEITATNSKTLCCRISASHDLVVKDEKFGISRFCINGSELVNHPLKVYVTSDCTVGTIKQNTVYVSEDAGPGIPIQSDLHTVNSYYVGRNTINCRSDVITLQWTTRTSVEMKALTLAFVIQCALTRQPITSSVTRLLHNIYDSKKDVTSLIDAQFQAQPIEHKPYKQSIFETFDNDVSLFIRAAGWIYGKDGCFYIIFNSLSPCDVVFMVHYFKVTNKWMMRMVDRDGNKQAVAIGQGGTGSGWHSQVTHNTINIGKICLFKPGTGQSALQTINGTIYEKPGKQGNALLLQYFDESKAEVARISGDIQPFVKLQIRKKLSTDEKRLILCCAINRAQAVYTINKRIPRILPISIITCDCDLCQECRNRERSYNSVHSFSEKLFIKAAGYSRVNNLVYYDVFVEPSSYVIHTVECTPRDKQQGIVRILVKDKRNNVLSTTVQFRKDIFAFYSMKNNLLGYQWKNLIFNAQNQQVMHIQKQIYTQKVRYQQEPSQKVKFAIYDNNDLLVAIISEDIHCMHIYNPKERTKIANRSILELVCAIPLAVKINSVVCKMDEWPLPEITYHYENVREPGNSGFWNENELE